jgi:hypothetical protein
MVVFLFNIIVYVFLFLCLLFYVYVLLYVYILLYVYVLIVCLCSYCMFMSYCIFMYFHRASWHPSATLTEVFPCFFLCETNARVKHAKMGHGPHSSIFVLLYVLFVLCRSVYCLCVNVHCTTATGWLPNCS